MKFVSPVSCASRNHIGIDFFLLILLCDQADARENKNMLVGKNFGLLPAQRAGNRQSNEARMTIAFKLTGISGQAASGKINDAGLILFD